MPRALWSRGPVPFTPRAKDTLELSMRHALTMGSNHIGSEHLLLGLIREGEGVGVRVLGDLGIDLDSLRAELLSAMAESGRSRPGYGTTPLPFSDELRDVLRRGEELAREQDAA
jgi:ATP-dependent Clp protease ATP-binding subunit ClpA